MKCPHCTKEIHFQFNEAHAYIHDKEIDSDVEQTEDTEEEEDTGFDIAHGFCPSCSELIVLVREGIYELDRRGKGELVKIISEDIVYPKNANIQKLPSEVPDRYSNEYDEATSVLSASPKASAAISRRLLQTLLHEEYKIKSRNLEDEIGKFIESKDIPSYIAEDVDAIRNIGNFAAHPLKNTNTGEIIDVEPGEAEWLIDVLYDLFDFTFAQPEKRKKRKEELNNKLEALGKRPMKSPKSKKDE